MDEIQKLFYCALAFLAFQLVVAFACWRLARKKGRDTVGWFLAGLFFSVGALLWLWLLPGVEAAGQTKACSGCGKIVAWRAEICPNCGSPLVTPEIVPTITLRRPLRCCFLVAFLIFVLLLVVLGLIGYFAVPDQPGKPIP